MREDTKGELLPGEDPDITDPIEIEHWITLYEERLEIWRRRLRQTPEPAVRGGQQAYLEWLVERVGFWRDRHARQAGLRLDPMTKELSGRQGTVTLTRREFELLSYLADHPGRHIPASLLVARAWPDSDLCEEQLRTYVGRLRRKMAEVRTPCRIYAERPRGYVLQFEEGVGPTAETRTAS
jgi:DNA-binding response OmpR family regulator